MRRHIPHASIILIAIAAYVNALPNEFVWDDHRAIRLNPLVKSLRHIPKHFVSDLYAGTGDHAGNYRPLVLMSFAVEFFIAGPLPWVFRITNILLHAIVSLLIYLVVKELVRGPPVIAVGSAILFAVHPVHAEVVSVIMGRSELIAAALVLLAWLVHLRGRRGSIPISMGLLFLALLGKETAAVYPFLLLAGCIHRGDPRRRMWRDFALAWIPFAIYVPIRLAALGDFAPTEDQLILPGMALGERLNISMALFGEYVILAAFPVKLSLDYQFLALPGEITRMEVASGGLFLLATLTLAYGGWRKRSPFFLAPVLFLVPLLPVSHIVPIGEIFAERFLYLPSIGFCLALALACSREPGWEPWALVILCAGFLAGLTMMRNGDLRSQGRAAVSTLRHYPNSYKAHADAGAAYQAAGWTSNARAHYNRAKYLRPRFRMARIGLATLHIDEGRPEEAERDLRALADVYPDATEIDYHLGRAILRQGKDRREEAVRHFLRAIERGRVEPDVRIDLAVIAYEAGRPAEALRILDEILEIHPCHGDTLERKGGILVGLERYTEAAEAMRGAVRWGRPDTVTWRVLGECEFALGRDRAATRAWRKALRLDLERNPEGLERARLLMLLGRLEDAEEMFHRLRARTPGDPSLVFWHAGVLDEMGRVEDAIRAFGVYLEMAGEKDPRYRRHATERIEKLRESR